VPFFKTKLKDLLSEETVEKNFKMNQVVQEVSLMEKRLEFLYVEGKDYLFLDVDQLEQELVPSSIIGDKVHYLKEGIEVKAVFYGDSVFSIEMPQFLELMVVKIDPIGGQVHGAGANKLATLETGAKVEVPLFVESGDIIKVDTQGNEYIQRV
jgi:elongation factor P